MPTRTDALTADTVRDDVLLDARQPVALRIRYLGMMRTDMGGGIYTNWIGAWAATTAGNGGTRLGFLLPYDEPNTPTVETQYYTPETMNGEPLVLAVGPNNVGDIPAQRLFINPETGDLTIYLPSIHPEDCVQTRFYVATDGSTYHSRADHDYTYSQARENITMPTCDGHGVVGPDLTPEQALVPEHLARAAP